MGVQAALMRCSRHRTCLLVAVILVARTPHSLSGSRGGLGRRGPSHHAADRSSHSLPIRVLAGPSSFHLCTTLSSLTCHAVLHRVGKVTKAANRSTRATSSTRFKVAGIGLRYLMICSCLMSQTLTRGKQRKEKKKKIVDNTVKLINFGIMSSIPSKMTSPVKNYQTDDAFNYRS